MDALTGDCERSHLRLVVTVTRLNRARRQNANDDVEHDGRETEQDQQEE